MVLQMVCRWEKEVSILQGNRTSFVESFKGCKLFSDGVEFVYLISNEGMVETIYFVIWSSLL